MKSILIKNVYHWRSFEKIDIYIEGNLIKKIGKNIQKKAKKVIDGKDKVVIPGFYNLHTHSPMSILKGYADDLPLKEWLEKKIWPKEATLTEDDIYWGTKFACLEMIKTGTVCFNDMYWHPQSIVTAVKEMGLRAFVGLVLLDFHPNGQKEVVLRDFQKLKKLLKKESKIQLTVAPHSIYTVSTENLKWCKKFATSFNIFLHLHLSETEQEVIHCKQTYNLTPVEYLEKLNILSRKTILAHCVWLTEKEIKILSKRKAGLVYNPVSNMKLASGIMPYKSLKKAKCLIGLGTDGSASNNNLNMIEEMKIGSLLQKIKERDPSVLSAKEIFKIATQNGAKILGLKAGEVRVGEVADLVLIDLTKIELIPNWNFISNLVYSANSSCIDSVICDGEVLMEGGFVEKEKEILNFIRKKYGN